MFARMSVTQGAAEPEAIAKQLATQVVPQIEGHPGFRGLTASLDAPAQRLYVLSLWETQDDLRGSAKLADEARRQAITALSATVQEVREWEQADQVIVTAPTAGVPLLVTTASMDPAALERNLAFFRDKILPGITSSPGFCTYRHFVDRNTGDSMVGTVWADSASLKLAMEMAGSSMSQAEAMGISFGTPSVRQVVFSKLPVRMG